MNSLPFILETKPERTEPFFEHLRSDSARIGARFWAGKHEGSQAKSVCVARLVAAWRDPTRVAAVVASLSREERTAIAVVRRYGGQVSGPLLQQELRARGVVPRPKPDDFPPRRDDLVNGLCERFVLIGLGYDYYLSSFRGYTRVALPPQVGEQVEPAPSLAWGPSVALEAAPESTTARAPAQLLVDLQLVARALAGMGRWKVLQGGALPASIRNKLAKLLPAQSDDRLEPPDRVALEYALLCSLGVAKIEGDEGSMASKEADSLTALDHDVRASRCVRAWLGLRTWQDGVGAVLDRDNRDGSNRIDPNSLRTARELLVWALTRVAHSPCDWLDLETFLLDLYAAIGEREITFFWQGYAWKPKFAAAAAKEQIQAGRDRSRAYWMDDEGVWAANALLSTFVHLGVVERGRSGGPRSERWAFRLTDLGKAVFGAPEVRVARPTTGGQCLTVQPNHEVLLYLDGADGAAVSMLGRIAARDSKSGIVQTFKLTRDSVYGALQEGLTPAEIESFLATRSRTPLPPNVALSLTEWSRRREALVVREAIGLATGLAESQTAIQGRAVGEGSVVASARGASKAAKELGLEVEPLPPARTWMIDEHGVVSFEGAASLVGLARLRRFATFADGQWKVSPKSVRAARELGIPADQVLEWLGQHVRYGVPPLLASAIRNWAGGRGRVFLGEVVILQVAEPGVFEALRHSARVAPLLEGVLAPDCLVVARDKRKELARIVEELGFSSDGSCRLRGGAGV